MGLAHVLRFLFKVDVGVLTDRTWLIHICDMIHIHV